MKSLVGSTWQDEKDMLELQEEIRREEGSLPR
jgi:hypothetical protein